MRDVYLLVSVLVWRMSSLSSTLGACIMIAVAFTNAILFHLAHSIICERLRQEDVRV